MDKPISPCNVEAMDVAYSDSEPRRVLMRIRYVQDGKSVATPWLQFSPGDAGVVACNLLDAASRSMG